MYLLEMCAYALSMYISEQKHKNISMSILAKLFEIFIEKHLTEDVFPLIRDAVLFDIPSKVPLDRRGLSLCTVLSDNLQKEEQK